MSNIAFEHPWLLWLLPLALSPLLATPARIARYPWLDLVPRDPLSEATGWFLRIVGCVAVGATVLALAGPYRPQFSVERVGRGAQTVLLLDRSLSMDQPFFPAHASGPYFSIRSPGPKERVARSFLAQFVRQRPADLFGMIVFSTFPIPVLPFTRKPELIQAAIRAGDLAHGLAETDVGAALLAAASMFDDQPYTASRVILFVSDGGAELDSDTRLRIRSALKLNRIALYWIYLRSFRSPGLSLTAKEPAPGTPAEPSGDASNPDSASQGAPERSLNAFFSTLPTAYKAYEADSPRALQSAIADVDRLENLPIHYREQIPRKDLTSAPLRWALAATLILLVGALLTVKSWP
jgi:mxaC protein